MCLHPNRSVWKATPSKTPRTQFPEIPIYESRTPTVSQPRMRPSMSERQRLRLDRERLAEPKLLEQRERIRRSSPIGGEYTLVAGTPHASSHACAPLRHLPAASMESASASWWVPPR